MVAIAGLTGWRLADGWPAHPGVRVAGAIALVAVLIAGGAWLVSGPLRPGWSLHAGLPALTHGQTGARPGPRPRAGRDRGLALDHLVTAVHGAGTTGPRPPAAQLPRLIAAGPPLGLQAHLSRYGPLPLRPGRAAAQAGLIAQVERAGLTGRGGAAFPAARKMRAVAGADRRGRRRGGAVLIANGAESEPASGKDSILLRQSPHLVLDGIALAAGAVGAATAYLCVNGTVPGRVDGLLAAVAERQQAGLAEAAVRVVAVPGGFVASEESALVNFLNGGPAVPMYVPPRPFERGVGGQATLVNNVETLAHMALIARYGPEWFGAVGTLEAPGSALVTIGGAVRRPGVYEIALGRRPAS